MSTRLLFESLKTAECTTVMLVREWDMVPRWLARPFAWLRRRWSGRVLFAQYTVYRLGWLRYVRTVDYSPSALGIAIDGATLFFDQLVIQGDNADPEYMRRTMLQRLVEIDRERKQILTALDNADDRYVPPEAS